jgi:hypothetical protein
MWFEFHQYILLVLLTKKWHWFNDTIYMSKHTRHIYFQQIYYDYLSQSVRINHDASLNQMPSGVGYLAPDFDIWISLDSLNNNWTGCTRKNAENVRKCSSNTTGTYPLGTLYSGTLEEIREFWSPTSITLSFVLLLTCLNTQIIITGLYILLYQGCS